MDIKNKMEGMYIQHTTHIIDALIKMGSLKTKSLFVFEEDNFSGLLTIGEQGVAQGVNLLSFLPMSFIALGVHAQNGLLQKQGLLPLIAPALVFSVLSSLLAAVLPAKILKSGFGVFLVVLSFFRFAAAFKAKDAEKGGKFSKNIK